MTDDNLNYRPTFTLFVKRCRQRAVLRTGKTNAAGILREYKLDAEPLETVMIDARQRALRHNEGDDRFDFLVKELSEADVLKEEARFQKRVSRHQFEPSQGQFKQGRRIIKSDGL